MFTRTWIKHANRKVILFFVIMTIIVTALSFPHDYRIDGYIERAAHWIIFPVIIFFYLKQTFPASIKSMRLFAAKNNFKFATDKLLYGSANGYVKPIATWNHVISGIYADKAFEIGVADMRNKSPIGKYVLYTGLLVLPKAANSDEDDSRLFFAALHAFGSKPEIKHFGEETYFIIPGGLDKTPDGMQKIFDFIINYR